MNDQPEMHGRCAICHQSYNVLSPLPSMSEIGEFVRPDGEHIIAHTGCGLDQGLPLA